MYLCWPTCSSVLSTELHCFTTLHYNTSYHYKIFSDFTTITHMQSTFLASRDGNIMQIKVYEELHEKVNRKEEGEG